MNNSILYVITVLIWGSTWLAIEYQLGVVEPEVSIAYRYAAAALVRKRPWVLRSAWALAFLFELHFRVPCPGSYYVGAGSDCVLDHALDEYHPV
jgi:hypothetical protein